MTPDSTVHLILSLARSYEVRTGEVPTHVHLGVKEWKEFTAWCDRQRHVVPDPRCTTRELYGMVISYGGINQGIALEVRPNSPPPAT